MNKLREFLKKNWVNNLLWVLAIAVVFFGVRAWQQQAMPKGLAPEISGVAVSGETVALSQYRGRPVMLYFWATWCKICEFEQGSIRSIANDHAILSVALRSGNALQVDRYMQDNGLKMPTLVDEYGELASRFGVRGTPTAFFIDAEGQIRSIEVGYTSEFGMRLRLWLASV